MSIKDATATIISRRQLLKAVSFTLAGLAAPLVVACGQQTATPAPAAAATQPPAPTTAPAAPTQAPTAAPTKPPAVAAPTTAAAASPAAGAAGTPRKGGTAIVAQGDDPQSPSFFTGGGSTHDGRLRQIMWTSLFVLDTVTGQLIPRLGTDLQISADAKEWTIKLRPGVKWSDGQPFNADDVIWTLMTYWSPKLVPPAPLYQWVSVDGVQDYQAGKTDKVAGLTKVDDLTVKINLSAANVALRGQIATLYPQPKHFWQDVPLDSINKSTKWLDNPVTNGPFKLTKFLSRQYAEFAANDLYWGGRPNLDKIIVQVAPTDAGLAALEAGQVMAVLYLTALDADRLKANANLRIEDDPRFETWGPWFNYRHKELQNKNVRLALAHAFDRNAYLKTVLGGHGNANVKPNYTPGHWAADPTATPYPYDPKKAKDLLTAANFNFNQKLTCAVLPANKPRADFATVMQANFQEIGIQMDIAPIEESIIGDELVKQSDRLWFLISYWGGESDPWSPLAYYHTQSGQNAGFYFSNISKPETRGGKTGKELAEGYTVGTPEIDALIDQIRATADVAKATPLFRRLDRWCYEEIPIVIPAIAPANIFGWSKKLQGYDNFKGAGRLESWYFPEKWWLSE
ncbi:MAG: ABC transporter substrate-binding protein [Chloroflexi bacterium]|nr:ABC transporter substrate-binding protein [Chloroflexota bacterium]